MCETLLVPVQDDGAFTAQQLQQQPSQLHQHSTPSIPKSECGDGGVDEDSPTCTPCPPLLPPLRPSSTSRPPGSPLPPLARGMVVSPPVMGMLPRGELFSSGVPDNSSKEPTAVPLGELKRTASQRDREEGWVDEGGGVEGLVGGRGGEEGGRGGRAR